MKPLDENLLKEIATLHGIEYDTSPDMEGSERSIKTRLARRFPEPKDKLFSRVANIEDHVRLFSHLKAINCITSKDVANVIGENQIIIVEGLAEGGSKLGVKLLSLFPSDRIECELFTDLFKSATRAGPLRTDPKTGAIFWEFYEVDDQTCIMQTRSCFEVGEQTAYIRGMIDHVWLDFFENLMIDLGELAPDQKRCAPVPKETGNEAWRQVA